jgi:hypothetical protein
MSSLQATLSYLGLVALAVVMAGLVVKRRVGLWYAFALLLVAVIVPQGLMTLWPSRFFRLSFWQTKEIAHNLIRFAMALELALRAFRAFPGALATARWTMLLVLALTLVAVMMAPTGSETRTVDSAFLFGELQARVVNGTVWLFTAIAALILWYRIPVHPFHKAVLLGYVPYLLVFTVLLNALSQMGWQRLSFVSYSSQIAYLALVTYWARAAWRRYPDAVLRPAPRQIAQTA